MSYVLQNDDGQITEAHSISAGLDYPGSGPEHAYYKERGRFEYESVTDAEALAAFQTLTRLEGIMPALESAHAVAWVLRNAPAMPKSKSIVVGLSGRGDKAFRLTAGECGVDGVIVADLPPEESAPLRALAEPAGLDLIHLVAPTSAPDRMRKIARASSGFLYMVSLTGVTGARAELPAELALHLRTLRGITTKPICVGFGIGTPAQAEAVGQAADGVIVGSAIVRLAETPAGP